MSRGNFDSDVELALQRLLCNLNELQVPRLAAKTLWVGCGLARLAALYGQELMHRRPGHHARAETLLSCIRMPPREDEMALLVSLRGRHPDVCAIAEYLRSFPGLSSVALTADTGGPAFRGWLAANRDLVTTPLAERDERFVNLKGLIVLSALAGRVADPAGLSADVEWVSLLTESCAQGSELGQRISERSDWRLRTTFVVSNGLSGSLARTWASLLGEAGLLNPVLVDLLDFTHGEHLAACHRDSALYIVLAESTLRTTCELFQARLGQLAPCFVVHVPAEIHRAYWSNLFTAAAAVQELSIAAGYGGRRPPKIEVVHSWRGWHGEGRLT